MTDLRLAAEVDAVVFGGGIAGLWSLHVLLAHGYDAWLCEHDALGAGQSIQAQGIVHGGGKYALRAVGDVEAMRAIREMPDRWRAHRSGTAGPPDLRSAVTASPGCWLWLPRASWKARLEAWGLVPLLRHGGILACPPVPVARSEWPEVLRKAALRAYRMEEPVLDTRSVLRALAEPVADRLLRIESGSGAALVEGLDARHEVDASLPLRLRAPGGGTLDVAARSVVFTAGVGNGDLLRRSGADPALMQRRPLRMVVLRGRLPSLHGHCISGGKTRITVTSSDEPGGERVWQVGGEVAERHAQSDDETALLRDTITELDVCLPGLDLSGVRMSSYAAVRAEARNDALRRPSGVQVRSVSPGVIVAWPTKWAMAPLLAEEVLREVQGRVGSPHEPGPLLGAGGWPRPDVAPFPWENLTWRAVPSERPD